jgi:hypothetical protein
MLNPDFKDVLEELKTLPKRKYGSGRGTRMSQEDKDEMFAIMARLLFAGGSNEVIGQALGRPRGSIPKLRKDPDFQVYYKAYIEKQLTDVDITLRGRIKQLAPKLLERMADLALDNDKHLQVSFHATKDLLDRYGFQPETTKQRGELLFPQGTLDALRAIGKQVLDAKALKNAKKGSGDGAGTRALPDSTGAKVITVESVADRTEGDSKSSS